MERSAVARTLCLVILLLFVMVCGLHLVGAHHDDDLDGLALADGLTVIALAGGLGLALALFVRRSNLEGANAIDRFEVAPRSVSYWQPRFKSVVPLRR